MRFSLQAQYAICGVFDLAYNGEGEPVRVKVVGERQAIPIRYLEQIFQRLRRAAIVRSKRGPGGGYVLARPPAEISLRDVVESVEGPLGDALAMPAAPGSPASRKGYRPDFLWGEVAEDVARVLEETSLERVCRDAARADVARAQGGAPMYFI